MARKSIKHIGFRQETFIEFIKIANVSLIGKWFVNILWLIMLLLFIFMADIESTEATIIGLLWMTIMFLSSKLFIYGMNYLFYAPGGKAIRELGEQEKIILENIELYTTGFDMFARRKHKNKTLYNSLYKTLYDFEKADIILTDKSLILMGKDITFGIVKYAYPIELINKVWLTSLPKANIIQWNENKNRIEIQIMDFNYEDIIKLIIKSDTEQIKQWLIRTQN